ncbi:MAG: ribonuclease III [bacterium]|nr:ribonuclease III [bacterium]
MNLSALEKNLGYSFNDKDLLNEALTHRSYLNENPGWKSSNNERLEFLGDAVLELAVTENLYHRYPDQQEGHLTSLRAALVNYIMMATVARELDLDKFMLLSQGESKDTGRARDVILANAMEAIIGAVYLDSDYQKSKTFIDSVVMTHLDEVIKKGLYKDAKSLLQEKVQATLKITPNYKVLEEHGPDHDRTFVVGVYFDDKLVARGNGPAKQDAEIGAAKEALKVVDSS